MTRSNAVAALMYHQIVDGSPWEEYTISRDGFYAHMLALAENGYIGLSLSDLLKWEQGTSGKKTIIITFDDGYKSDVEYVLPILREFGFTATFFITTGYVGADAKRMSWENIKLLHSNGIQIGAHGLTHAFLDNLSQSELDNELTTPKCELEELLGEPVDALSFPGGRYSQATIERAHAAGYRLLCTSRPGFINVEHASTAKTLGRFTVKMNTSPDQILLWADGDLRSLLANGAIYYLKKFGKMTIGNSVYHKVWDAWNSRVIKK